MSDERILRLPQLPKLHLTVPPPTPDLRGGWERLVQVTRITGALSINIAPNFVNVEDIDAARAIIERVNTQFNRTPPAKLTLVSYPYNQNSGYPKPNRYRTADHRECDDCPPAGPADCPDDPRQTCRDQAAVDAYAAAIGLVLQRVPVSLIGQQFFDTERWNTTRVTDWDAAITAKHNRFHTTGKGAVARRPCSPVRARRRYDGRPAVEPQIQPRCRQLLCVG